MTSSNLLRLVAIAATALAPRLESQRHMARTIAVGESRTDTLHRRDVLMRHDSTHAKDWQIRAAAGQVVTIDLVSERFDAYLIVYGRGLKDAGLQDDDSGGSCNARLTVRFPESGAYHIVVTSAEKLQTGPYTLSVTSGPRPPSLVRCRRTPSR